MLKVSHFRAETDFGVAAVPLFSKADAFFEKTASARLLPEVVQYIAGLQPRGDSQYVLVNAMGASEWYGSNVNGDAFPEAALIHKPDDWTGNPVLDRIRGGGWPYGFPTFYGAHPYAHHRNKDASRAFGEVELTAWNPDMRRVELVTRIDRDKCHRYGGEGTWDKLRSGAFPDVSMGTKVPFDTCSICLDQKLYHEGLDNYDPARHKHPGMAALEFHKNLVSSKGKGIRGLSITRADYCTHALKEMNRIYPDGRKVFVNNDFPKFFDISFVFIGADKTAKTMLFIFSSTVPHSIVKPSALVADELGVGDSAGGAKTASAADEILKQAFGAKLALNKRSEIDKNVIPSQFAGKAVPVLTQYEPDLPPSLIGRLSTLPLENVLATLGGLGILVKPREFQQLTLAQLGEDKLAAALDREGAVFEKSAESEPFELGTQHYLPALAEILTPLTASRSLLSPSIDQRFLLTKQSSPRVAAPRAPSHSKELLDKIARAYNGYRHSIMGLISHAPHLAQGSSLHKHASVVDAFSPLSAEYLRYAYADGFGTHEAENRPRVGVERGIPSKNTWSNTTMFEEFHR